MYETKISDARWCAYDVPGNIGWIMYLIGLGRMLAKNGLSLTSVLMIIPAVLILVGIAELISERIAKLDRVLSAVRLWRGFGALTFGGLLGAVFSGLTIGKNLNAVNAVIMIFGGILCFVFAGLLLVGYKKTDSKEG